MEPVQEVAEDQGDAEAAEPVDSKWSLKQLREEYERLGIDYVEVFGRIKDVCIKTLMSVEPYIISQMRTTKHRNCCYEVYGFDVLVDANLKPWLLEVNVAPSLSSSSPFDKQVKSMLLSDTFHLLGFSVFDRKQLYDQKKRDKKKKALGIHNSHSTSKSKARNLTNDTNSLDTRLRGGYENGTITDISSKSTEMTFDRKKTRSPNFLEGHPSLERDLETKPVASPEKFRIHNKMAISSFLQGFDYLTEDDLEILANYEEEQYRRTQTQLDRLFPTKETVESLGNNFDCQRRANLLVWQYIR